MPWSEKQMSTAQAVAHGWTPKGSAKGFTQDFAAQVVAEGVKGKKRKRGTLGELGSLRMQHKG